MKQTLTILMLLVMSVGKGQRTTLENRINLLPKDVTDNGWHFDLRSNSNEIARIKSNSDTLEITSPKVKFIKIDGKVFEIKRDVKLEEVQQGFYWSGGRLTIDTIHNRRIMPFYPSPINLNPKP